VSRTHGRDPLPLSSSLGQVVRALRPGDGSAGSHTALGGVFGRWTEAVGPSVAAHAQPVKLDGTRLLVEVDDPAWATQLRFLEVTLCERLLAVAGAVVEHLDVRVRRR
jgi:predicted nucleic acid-binding Zn ribbon protein